MLGKYSYLNMAQTANNFQQSENCWPQKQNENNQSISSCIYEDNMK